nr:MAG TPA: hypothetical protein [Caudoviricetes sp.]
MKLPTIDSVVSVRTTNGTFVGTYSAEYNAFATIPCIELKNVSVYSDNETDSLFSRDSLLITKQSIISIDCE